MTEAEYTNLALTDVCEMLLDQYRLSPDEIASLAKDIPGECRAMADNRRALSTEGEKDAPKDDGWIEWKGGKCPVDQLAEVMVKLGDGRIVGPHRASNFVWGKTVDPLKEIRAYRVARP